MRFGTPFKRKQSPVGHRPFSAMVFAAFVTFSTMVMGEPLIIAPDLAPSDFRGDLQVWGWNIAAASLNKLVPAFNTKYPNVVVHVNMTGTNLQSRFLLSLSANVGAPDISQLQLAEAARYARTRKLTDLTAVAQQYEKDFPASFWQNCVFEDRIYAIPWDMGPCAVFYKRHIFQQYEIDPDKIETWDDFIATGKRLLGQSGGKTKLFVMSTGAMTDMFEILLQQSGGQVFDSEGRVAVNSPQTARVVDMLRRFIEAGITVNVPPYSHAYFALLKSDAVATFPSAVWFGGTIRDYAPEMSGDWGVFRLPALEPGGLRTSNLGGSVLVIPDQCKQKEAAWAFVEYSLCTREAQIAQYRNFDLFPGLLPTHQDPFFDEPDAYFGGQKARRLFSLDIEKIPPLNRTKDWYEGLWYISKALSKWAANGTGPTEELLSPLAKGMARRLGRELAPSVSNEKGAAQ